MSNSTGTSILRHYCYQPVQLQPLGSSHGNMPDHPAAMYNLVCILCTYIQRAHTVTQCK